MKGFSKGIAVGVIIGFLFAAVPAVIASSTQIKIVINGQEIKCDVAPQNINGRVMVPARFIAEPLGANVTWDGVTQTVYINSVGNIPTHVPSTTVNTDAQKAAYFIGKMSYIETSINVIKNPAADYLSIQNCIDNVNSTASELSFWSPTGDFRKFKDDIESLFLTTGTALAVKTNMLNGVIPNDSGADMLETDIDMINNIMDNLNQDKAELRNKGYSLE